MLKTQSILASEIDRGDHLLIDNLECIIFHVSLLRGMDIEILYRPRGLLYRNTTERRMVVPKRTIFERII